MARSIASASCRLASLTGIYAVAVIAMPLQNSVIEF